MSADHQSIGEVLATLRGDFPDITISKIRFLESQGLIDPERTPSGYRKFRDGDVARLRWILHQQKDNFLPLKVIKARLDEAGPDGLPEDLEPPEGAATATAEPQTDPAPEPAPEPAARVRPAKARATKAKKTTAKPAGAATEARRAPAREQSATPPAFETPMLPLDDAPGDDLEAETSGASLTRAELLTASGLTETQLVELEEYGLVSPAAGSGQRVVYAEDALVVANLASEFAAHGIGPRHLRMYRAFADREAGLYDQVIAPRLRRKNPDARAQARADLVDLARLGRALRSVFLREATAGHLRD